MNDIEKNHVRRRKIIFECLCQGFVFFFLNELDNCDVFWLEFVMLVNDDFFFVSLKGKVNQLILKINPFIEWILT